MPAGIPETGADTFGVVAGRGDVRGRRVGGTFDSYKAAEAAAAKLRGGDGWAMVKQLTQRRDDHRIAALKAGKRAKRLNLPLLQVRARDADGVGSAGLQIIADAEGAAVIVAKGTKYHGGKIFFPKA